MTCVEGSKFTLVSHSATCCYLLTQRRTQNGVAVTNRPPPAETSRLNSQSVQFTKAGGKGREDSK
ncbi:hypothetical protein T10_72 [Trichinella papuae]|uniref:Uncharacterized protein n=1 Tax=Trichinella papuae TaxID=268474 RepID=A0A0V1M5I2_9BILA|nr:hypothetical protein T10_72 [Trichinella papuae]